MKTCDVCGGSYYRHGPAATVKHNGEPVEAYRYKCRGCGKCITVRNGERANPIGGRPMLHDWRATA